MLLSFLVAAIILFIWGINFTDIINFITPSITENGKIRKVGEDTVFKIQADYNKIDAAKRAFDLEAKKELKKINKLKL